MSESANITELLAAWRAGKTEALDRLMPLVETELRRVAHRQMRRENGNHVLQTSALVNETFLGLVEQKAFDWQNQSHFLALSSQIMRRILLNHARENLAGKSGGAHHVSSEDAALLLPEKSVEIIAINDALEALEKFDRLKSQIVEMRYSAV